MGLTASIAHCRASLTTSHPSPYAVIIPLGEWEEGGANIIMPQMGIEEGGIMMLARGQEVAVTPYVGRGISWRCLCRRFRGVLDSIGEVMLDVLGAASGEEDEKVRGKEDSCTNSSRFT
jgi:hypothetical protein